MREQTNDLRHRVAALLGESSDHVGVTELRRRLLAAGALTRRRLLDAIGEFMRETRALEDERSRALLARLIAASTPESLDAIHIVLAGLPSGDLTSELQFSLFVALADVPQALPAEVLSAIVSEVERYLLNTVTDTAEAAWMAGDLLGDHWSLEQSLPVLLRVARNAKHRVGREGAIHGLSHALVRATKRDQWSIMDALRQLATTDGDEAVRQYAESVMGDFRGL